MLSNARSSYRAAPALGKTILSLALVALYVLALFVFIQLREPTIGWLLFEFVILGGFVGGSLLIFIAWLFHLLS